MNNKFFVFFSMPQNSYNILAFALIHCIGSCTDRQETSIHTSDTLRATAGNNHKSAVIFYIRFISIMALIAKSAKAKTAAYGCELIVKRVTDIVPSKSEAVVLHFIQTEL